MGFILVIQMGAGAGAERHTSQFKSRVGTERSKSPVWHKPMKSPPQSPVLWEKEAKNSTFKKSFFSRSRTEDFFGISETSTSMPELLGEHLHAANLGKYIPEVSRWMEKEGVLDFAELGAVEMQDLYEELGLSTKSRRLFDICLGLYLEVLVKRQIA